MPSPRPPKPAGRPTRSAPARARGATTGVERVSLRGHRQGVKSVAFTPDGKRLASGSDDKTIKLWDVDRAQELLTLSGHGHWVNGVAFAPDGQALASVSRDGTVRLWLAARK